MTPEERDLIIGLFQRLTPPPPDQIDEEARDLIDRLVRERPYAPYLLVQTALVEEHALKGAQARIAELEAKLASCAQPGQASGRKSFLSGLFGGDSSPRPAPPPQAPSGPQPYRQGYAQMGARMGAGGPWGYRMGGGMGGPSFLQSALSTAAGVAGGALLFQGIEHLLGYGGSPFAQVVNAEPAADRDVGDQAATGNVGNDQGGGFLPDDQGQNADYQNADYTTDDPGNDFGDGGFGDGGDFDDGSSI